MIDLANCLVGNSDYMNRIIQPTSPSAHHALFPMGRREGRASTMHMQGIPWVRYGKGVR